MGKLHQETGALFIPYTMVGNVCSERKVKVRPKKKQYAQNFGQENNNEGRRSQR